MKKYIHPKYMATMVSATDEDSIQPYSRKPIPCELIFITEDGRESPIKCRSLSEAIRLTNKRGEPYRIYVDGKCVKYSKRI